MPIEYDLSKTGPIARGQKSDDPTSDEHIVSVLEGYRKEAEAQRSGGLNPRDAKWKENLDLYWNRWDFSDKADWQAQETMPEVPQFVDRFAAAMKEALIGLGAEGFYTVIDPADEDGDIANAIKEMTDVWLSQVGQNSLGQTLAFPAVFEEQMKMGALMACCATITWKDDVPGGRVSMDTQDPRSVWLDHTNRGLYRIRRIEQDRHVLYDMVNAKDGGGKNIFNLPAVENFISHLTDEDAIKREQLTGTGSGQASMSNRVPVILDEYIATVIGTDGKIIQKEGMYVVANNEFLVRGPEKNPFWHDKDWLLYAPLVTAPMSVYGRSYMEDFGSVATAFNELTNLILDAVHTSALKAFVMVPELLSDPSQVASGIWGNKIFEMDLGAKPEDFAKALDLGRLPSEAVTVWQAMKSELREAANVNEIGLGQFAPKGRTSATEISATQRSSSAMVRSVAESVETRLLDVGLDLIWKTGLQHAKKNDKALRRAAGAPMFDALMGRRRELITKPITFQARGISTLIERGQMLNSLMQILTIVASNDILLQEFLKKIDVEKLVELLFTLSNVPLKRLQASEREKLIRSATEPINALQEPGAEAPSGSAAPGLATELTQTLNIGQGG